MSPRSRLIGGAVVIAITFYILGAVQHSALPDDSCAVKVTSTPPARRQGGIKGEKAPQPTAVVERKEEVEPAQPEPEETPVPTARPPAKAKKPKKTMEPVEEPQELPATATPKSDNFEPEPASPTTDREVAKPPAAIAEVAGENRQVARWKKRKAMQDKLCPVMRDLRFSLLTLPGDICELLPHIEAYSDEVDVAAEAGSRLGSSTLVFLNRHNEKFASLEIDVKNEIRTMHEYHNKCIKDSPSALVPSQIVEGDDIKMGLPWDSVELFFIDTIHNADQLYKELEVFPSKVTKYLAFHDISSFRSHNEENRIRRKDVPAEVHSIKGLHRIISDWLKKHSDEWVEELGFTYNNGFLVLRNRKFVPKVLPLSSERRQFIYETSAAEGIKTLQDVSQFLDLNSGVVKMQDRCMKQFRQLGSAKPAHIVLCGGGYGGYISERYVRAMGSAVKASDSIPLFNKISLAHGYSNNLAKTVFILNPESSITSIDQGHELLVLLAAAGGAIREKKRITVVCSDADVCSADNATSTYAAFKTTFPELARNVEFSTKSKGNSDLVVLASSTLAAFEKSEHFGSAGRIFVHGTAIHDATEFAPKGFELLSALNEGMGTAVWEKMGSQRGHYVTLP